MNAVVGRTSGKGKKKKKKKTKVYLALLLSVVDNVNVSHCCMNCFLFLLGTVFDCMCVKMFMIYFYRREETFNKTVGSKQTFFFSKKITRFSKKKNVKTVTSTR